MYQGACEALDALATRLSSGGSSSSSGGGAFFFGAQPSSLDALLYSCLAYLRAAPVVHPQLAQKLAAHRVLGAYLDRIAELAFSSAVPTAAEAQLDWSQWGAAGQADEKCVVVWRVGSLPAA